MTRRQFRDREDIDPIRPVPDWRQGAKGDALAAAVVNTIIALCFIGVVVGIALIIWAVTP